MAPVTVTKSVFRVCTGSGVAESQAMHLGLFSLTRHWHCPAAF